MLEQNIKQKFLLTFLKNIPFEGCSQKAIDNTAHFLNIPIHEQILMFPSGLDDILADIQTYFDEQMIINCSSEKLEALKIREKVAMCVWQRFKAMTPYKQAIIQIYAHLAMPHNLLKIQKHAFQTASEVWYMIGDKSTDWNFYSKRILLSMVYLSSLLCWFQDTSEGFEDTRSFLERRIENVMLIPKAKLKIKDNLEKVPNFFSLLKKFREI